MKTVAADLARLKKRFVLKPGASQVLPQPAAALDRAAIIAALRELMQRGYQK